MLPMPLSPYSLQVPSPFWPPEADQSTAGRNHRRWLVAMIEHSIVLKMEHSYILLSKLLYISFLLSHT